MISLKIGGIIVAAFLAGAFVALLFRLGGTFQARVIHFQRPTTAQQVSP